MIQSIEVDRVIGIETYLYNAHSCGRILEQQPPRITSFTVVEHLNTIVRDKMLKRRRDAYTLALLEKEGYDTYTALRILSSKLRLDINAFRYFGLKDANARTYQYVVLPGVLSEIIEVRGDKGFIRLYPVGSLNKVPSGRFHDVNIFKIKLEGLSREYMRLVNNRLRLVAKYGVMPSYYGYQRFGSIRPLSHLVGKYIVEKDYCKALDIFITSIYPDESSPIISARRSKTSLPYPERIVLYKLKRGKSCREVVEWLDNSYQGLFTAAYASYLFNKIVSRVLTMFTLEDLFEKQTGYTRHNTCKLLSRTARIVYLDEDYAKKLVLDICDKEEFVGRHECIVLMERTRMFKRPLLFPLRIFGVRESRTGITIGVVLPRGAYATVFLREVFCNITLSSA